MSTDTMNSNLRRYVAAQGVGILPRALYANLRTGPVMMYGERALAGTAGTITELDETGNAEALLVGATGANGYKGWLFGFAVDVPPEANTGLELAMSVANMQIQINSSGVSRNYPIGVATRIFGTNGTAGANPQQTSCLCFYRFPNAIPWDGTDSASYIRLLNTNTAATTATQEFTVYVDAWLAMAADRPAPDVPILFPPDCDPRTSNTAWIEKLAVFSKVRSALRG